MVRDDGESHCAETLRVVDVVAEIRHVLQLAARALTHERKLVVDSLHAIGSQLLCARADDRVALHRDDQVADADLVEPAQAEAIGARERKRLLAALVHPDAVVGEDAVEVEDREPQLPQQRFELRHGCAAACAPACSETGSTSSKVTKSSNATGRRRRLPTSRSSS